MLLKLDRPLTGVLPFAVRTFLPGIKTGTIAWLIEWQRYWQYVYKAISHARTINFKKLIFETYG
jgi:hypothetical protein